MSERGLEDKSNFSEILQLRCFCDCCNGVTLSLELVFQKRKVLMVRLQLLCGHEIQKQSQENPYFFYTLFLWEVLAQSGSLIKLMENRNKRMRITCMSNDEDISTKYLFFLEHGLFNQHHCLESYEKRLVCLCLSDFWRVGTKVRKINNYTRQNRTTMTCALQGR